MPALLAELLGTFAIVFAGAGAAAVSEAAPQTLAHGGVCAVFGLTVASMIYALGEISGAHFNPAVSLGFVLSGRMNLKTAFAYSGAQVTGAALAGLLLLALFPESTRLGGTQPAGPVFQSLALECILTFFLMLVILRVSTGSKEKGITAGLAIGSVVALCALMGGPVSGASMNPARSFGPALALLDFSNFWIYVAGPVSGVVLAALADKAFTALPAG